jgi:peptidoglycan/xylan/chitin deacetylase (PgdA/CDA1 family)
MSQRSNFMIHTAATRFGSLSPLVFALCLLACERAPQAGADAPAGTGEPAPVPADAAVPRPPAMAITIDDLPWIGAVRPGTTREDALALMIEAFVSRGVPALGFLNCDRAGPGAPLPRMWLEAGLELGNHTAAHLDLNEAPLDQWLRDVRSCHAMVRELTASVQAAATAQPAPAELQAAAEPTDVPPASAGQAGAPATRTWFRYPFLHQGPTAERQEAAVDLLQELGSPIAHVTIDNSDWILAVAYGDAVTAGDAPRAVAIADAFIDHILRATEHYQQVALEREGRDVPHVLLLHANLLVAEHIGRLLDRLATERGFRFVSVEAAHRDPVYDRPDGYTGSRGLSWLYRIAPPAPELAAWDDAEAQRLRQQWR